MQSTEVLIYRVLFVAAAIWNLAGGIVGYGFTEQTFLRLFETLPSDPMTLSIFQGATGTTLTYFFGYLIVAANPLRQTGVVIIGTIGKVGFAIQMWKFYAAGIANSNALTVVVGDLLFVVLFLIFLFRVFRSKRALILGD